MCAKTPGISVQKIGLIMNPRLSIIKGFYFTLLDIARFLGRLLSVGGPLAFDTMLKDPGMLLDSLERQPLCGVQD